MIKNAYNIEEDLDNKSLLALSLVLLKQVQPLVSDFEAHESRFQYSLSQIRSVNEPGKSFIDGSGTKNANMDLANTGNFTGSFEIAKGADYSM